ncbi:hypothetical protein, partial [Curtobacterium sp. CT11-133]|uniref:hypothetical protein n=1 Tax=Curtobacterium sp. CT11-133 TaxID=3243014 RepID=UPI0039AEA9B5
MTDPKDNVPNEDEPQVEGDATNAAEPEDLIEAEGPDVEVPTDGPGPRGPAADAHAPQGRGPQGPPPPGQGGGQRKPRGPPRG